MKLGEAHIIQGNALDLPLPDNSVDLICTSPPYFGLRSYQDGGKHYDGQIGSEPTPAEFLDALLAATREMVRVLKPTGSIFVNLGDKYSTTDHPGNGIGGSLGKDRLVAGTSLNRRLGTKQYGGIKQKSLIGIPWRYAIRCIDDLGLILRAEIIWSKPNGLPESVTDRVRRSHEQWFHFTKQPKYFAAIDEIREPQTGVRNSSVGQESVSGNGLKHRSFASQPENWNPLGKLPGSVWTVPTQPLTVPSELGIDHFAAYPMEWPRRIIQGWTPNGVCVRCKEGRRPVMLPGSYDPRILARRGNANGDGRLAAGLNTNPVNLSEPEKAKWRTPDTITGYVCGCPDATAPTTPAVVLDPFGGTGTTALVAKALGRIGISVDLSHDYCRMAVWRTNDPGELASALQVEKPEPVPDGQVALF